ncbi:MAG: VWA domain-containing protein [Candidatus Gracilibacteria bacterium]
METNNKNGIDIQIVLDVSYSMIAEDLKPNRLEVAKLVISDFLDKIHSDRVGIIIFAGKTFTSLPLNFDYNIIKKIVEKININTINQNYNNMQGTAIGDALVLAVDSFGDNENREKIIILLTDGEANKGLNPLIALKYIQSTNADIKIYTIGIGEDEETSIVIKNNFGQSGVLPVGGVDEKTLKTISSQTNGKYYRATDKKTLENIFNEISKLERKDIIYETIKINKEKYNYFVYILILFFMILLFIKNKKKIF